jgi:hypothetical protein
MTRDDYGMIAQALRIWADRTEASVFAQWTPKRTKEEAARARELAAEFERQGWGQLGAMQPWKPEVISKGV